MKLIISGAAGRMGRAILDTLYHEEDLELGAALEKKGHPAIGRDAGELIGVGKWKVSITDQMKKAIPAGEAVIDFTSPQNTLAILQEAMSKGKPMVIGTTGFLSDEEKKSQRPPKKFRSSSLRI
ncbi:MAG: hypothetical protein MPW14_17650 [Candidatus Manganitrophus sp.]|nr:MAG: hypothetical protein MPW14_17650 [Candidatus Manganitrophus sp.]